MFRKHLIKLLLENPMSLRQIARMEEELPDRIADDLNHLFRSLKHTEVRGCDRARPLSRLRFRVFGKQT